MRILKLLIENGASIDFKALDGATALTYAVNYREKEMAEILIENGANVNSIYLHQFENSSSFCSDA